MGEIAKREPSLGSARSRRVQLLASVAAAGLLVGLVAEAKAGEAGGWLVWSAERQAASSPGGAGEHLLQERMGPSWDGLQAVAPTDPSGDLPQPGLVAREKAGLVALSGQFADQGDLGWQFSGADQGAESENQVTQRVFGGDWQGAGSIGLHNDALIFTDSVGMAATAKALFFEGARQVAVQRSAAALERSVLAASDDVAGSSQTIGQRNRAEQAVLVSDRDSTGTVEIVNSGTSDAAKEGIRALSNFRQKFVVQDFLLQGSEAGQTEVAAGVSAAAATSSAPPTPPQRLEQANEAVQVAADSVATVPGSISVRNGGEILSGGVGVNAASRLKGTADIKQRVIQGNRAPQLIGDPAFLAEEEGEHGRWLSQSNFAHQNTHRSDWTTAGVIDVHIGGPIAADVGIELATSLLHAEAVRQRVLQDNGVLQDGWAAEQDDKGALAVPQQELHQENYASQSLGGSFASSAGAIALENSGEIRSDWTAISAQSEFGFFGDTSQRVLQRNEARQPPTPEVDGKEGPLLRQSNNSYQYHYTSDRHYSGAVRVNNTARLLAGWDGVFARSEFENEDAAEQRSMQQNRTSLQTGSRAGPPVVSDALQAEGKPRLDQENRAQQTFTGTTGTSVGVVFVENSGEIRSAWEGIYAGSGLDLHGDRQGLRTKTSQHLLQENQARQPCAASSACSSRSSEADAAGAQLLMQSNTAEQRARSATWEGAGAIEVHNSGPIFAEASGIHAAGRLAVEDAMDQTAFQYHETSPQPAGQPTLA